MNLIDWESSASHLLLNPSYSKIEKKKFHRIVDSAQAWPGHFWLSTSGSSSAKWVGVSKKAVLSSAEAVNHHLECTKKDIWVNCLPHFHVGGLAIFARAYLSNSTVFDFKANHPGKWRPDAFYNFLLESRGTLTALVPTQVFDLVTSGYKAPPQLRAAIIGGGALLPDLYERGVDLGWPLLPSYGLTECASQVATARLGSWQDKDPSLHLLKHLQVRVIEQQLSMMGSSLLSAYAIVMRDGVSFFDPKRDGWLLTEDRAAVDNRKIEIFGRADAVVKVGGENVDVAKLESTLQALRLKMGLTFEATLIAVDDTRLGHSIHLAAESQSHEAIAPLIDAFQSSVLPFEKIRKTYLVDKLPRSSLGKILKQDLLALITTSSTYLSN